MIRKTSIFGELTVKGYTIISSNSSQLMVVMIMQELKMKDMAIFRVGVIAKLSIILKDSHIIIPIKEIKTNHYPYLITYHKISIF